jgi:hypothetical protein
MIASQALAASRERAWEFRYEALRRYAEANGSSRLRVEVIWESLKLGFRVGSQRQAFAAGKLSDARRRKLELLPGWSWNARVDDQDAFIALVAQWCREHGHSSIDCHAVVGHAHLGQWVRRQRDHYRVCRIGASTRAKLEAIEHWCWTQTEARWQAQFQRAASWIEERGHSSFAAGHADSNLRSWGARQRAQWRAGALPVAQVEMLETIECWHWTEAEARWLAQFHRAASWIKEHGHSSFAEAGADADLQSWAARQRVRRRAGALTNHQVEMLDSVKQ